ncbi:OprD family outer membrane porin [Pseudomonas sp. GG8]
MSGDSAFPYVDGSDPFLINFVQLPFCQANEHFLEARYDYDFAKLGRPRPDIHEPLRQATTPSGEP